MTDLCSLDPLLERAAKRFGTPAYVYFTNIIEQRLCMLRETMGSWFSLSYAVKCNPNPTLLGWLRDRVDLLDISSIGEFGLALDAGWQPGSVSFTGPGKRDFELLGALKGGIGELVLESLREAIAADRIAGDLGKIQEVLVRVAPTRVPKGFGDQMAGRPSPFGFDVEVLDRELPKILALRNLRVVGLHIYSGTQCLKPDALCENYRIFLSIFREVCDKHDLIPQKLVFGSGLGIPYHIGDKPLDLENVAQGIADDLDSFCSERRFADTQLILELGRYLVGEAGYFLTRVISIKESRGSYIGICDGGMNNHLPASGHFGMVIHRNYAMHKIDGGPELEKIDLVGPLCTSIDRLATGVVLPRLEEGDLIAIHNSGAYGLTASPLFFISHQLPCEVLVDGADMADVTRICQIEADK